MSSSFFNVGWTCILYSANTVPALAAAPLPGQRAEKDGFGAANCSKVEQV
jgi:hypothetical protein